VTRTPLELWRRAPRWARGAAVASSVVLLVLPLLLSLIREHDYSASVNIERTLESSTPAFERDLPFPEPSSTYVSRLLETKATRIGIAAELSYLVSPDDLVNAYSVDESSGPRATVTARADTPERARELAEITGLQLVAASSREVDAAAENRLQSGHGDEFLREASRNPPSRIFPATEPEVPDPHGIDKLVDELPGAFPPRPSPWLSLLVGLLAAAVAGWALLTLGAARKQ